MKVTRRTWLVGVAALTLAAAANAAEKFEDAGLGIRMEAPDGFVAAAQKPPIPETLGEIKGFYTSPQAAENAGFLMIHHMTVPGGMGFDAFKGAFPGRIGEQLGQGFKQVKQEDVEVGRLKGFMFEFEAPGNGMLPEAGGSIPHRVRWYMFQHGAERIIGVVYHSRGAAWAELDPRFATSYKSLKPL